MTQINLFPWREKLKEIQKKQFFMLLVGCIISTIILIILYHAYMAGLIRQQKLRNNFQTVYINRLQEKIIDLTNQEKIALKIEKELQFLFSLKNESFQSVRLLDDLPRVTPNAVLLSTVSREDNVTMIYGIAQSTLQVTQLMKNLTLSNVFKQPELVEISTKKGETDNERYFQLKVVQYNSEELS